MPNSAAGEPVNIICMKWGTMYGPEYVNNLKHGVDKFLKRPHRFVCFTDDSEGLVDGIETFPMPEIKLPDGENDTRWKKLALFSNPLADLTGTCLFLDLDLVIVGSLDEMLEFPGAVPIIRDDDLFRAKPLRKVNPERDRFFATVGNSSVFRYEIGKYDYVLQNYVANPAKATAEFENEQQFLTAELARDGHIVYWPKEWCVSFKNHCVPRNFLSYFSDPVLPPDAKIVVFAGNPKMHEVLEGRGNRWYRRIGDVTWLRDAWSGQN